MAGAVRLSLARRFPGSRLVPFPRPYHDTLPARRYGRGALRNGSAEGVGLRQVAFPANGRVRSPVLAGNAAGDVSPAAGHELVAMIFPVQLLSSIRTIENL